MAYLREAVEKQKEFLINQLVNKGFANLDNNLKDKTLSELVNDYDQFSLITQQSNNNSLRFTRKISLQDNRKPI